MPLKRYAKELRHLARDKAVGLRDKIEDRFSGRTHAAPVTSNQARVAEAPGGPGFDGRRRLGNVGPMISAGFEQVGRWRPGGGGSRPASAAAGGPTGSMVDPGFATALQDLRPPELAPVPTIASPVAPGRSWAKGNKAEYPRSYEFAHAPMPSMQRHFVAGPQAASPSLPGVLNPGRQGLGLWRGKHDVLRDAAADPTKEKPLDKGGAYSKLDEVHYRHDQLSPELQASLPRNADGEFEGYFKPDKLVEKGTGAQDRMQNAGLDVRDPNITGRNLATQAVAKILRVAELIPKTVAAVHQHQFRRNANHNIDAQGNVTPLTPRHEALEARGVVVEKVHGDQGAVRSDFDRTPVEYQDPKVNEGLSKLYLLDTVCGQVDRHPGNFIIEKSPDGTILGVKAIDNDMSFGDKYTGWKHSPGTAGRYLREADNMRNTYMAGHNVEEVKALYGIDKRLAERIIEVANDPRELREAITPFLLKTSEVDATISRLQSLAGFLAPLLADPTSPYIKSTWAPSGAPAPA